MAYLWIALGAVVGASARYFLSGFIAKVFPSSFPCGTLIINITGSLLLGFFLVWTSERVLIEGAGSFFDAKEFADVERMKALFKALDEKNKLLSLLDRVQRAKEMQIFIGAANPLFGVAGCSVVIAPYLNSREQIVGAIGVIGPTRINYARIIPMVDYTAKVIGRFIG